MQLELQAIIIVVAAVLATAFVPGPVAHRSRALHMNTGFFDEALVDKTLPKDAMVAQRYIATNRFKVRNNAGPKFEKRWAERKSRLADLEGFRFFNLMKRVDEFGADYTDDDGLGNYVSSTVWADKDCFDAWRTGDAFKEAHGGGGLSGFVGLLTTALFILDGGPKPAFYDGLLPYVNPEKEVDFEAEGGWRKISADGQNFLPADIFVSQYRFKVPQGEEVAFESKLAKMESDLKGTSGLVNSYLQRRDALKADDGYNYIASFNWKDKSSFASWKDSGSPIPQLLSSLSPKPVYYEGKLALASSIGG